MLPNCVACAHPSLLHFLTPSLPFIIRARSENLLDLFKVDLWNINIVAGLAYRFDPQTEAAGSNWKEIAATSGKVLYREVDFNIEREAAQSFADNFAKFDAIKIPSVHPELSSSKAVSYTHLTLPTIYSV